MKVITFSSLKGGTSKSTLVLSTAGRKGLKHKILVLDLDEQRNVTSVLRSERDTYTIYDVLAHKTSIKEAIKHSQFKNVDYISGSLKINDVNVDKLALKKLLQDVYNDYDFVLIDTPPSINSVVQSAYIASDLIFIPSILDKFSSANLMTVVGEIKKLNQQASIKVIPTMKIKNSKLHTQVHNELKSFIDSREDISITNSLPNSIEISNQMMENKLLVNSNKVNRLKTALKKLIDKEI
ncbi:ParA family protein [Staphylococcus shinii]|uniref:ParA family protein n=1 Tax=Staphylococcus shinii TaxID=2912228 RepID=UPI003F84D703